ncbi:WD40-repeat-containing domain protein [Chlamydoabsidia padenii]|nr:WD40-repeat-containing domain protein [Chlamydoabsidia padenii]
MQNISTKRSSTTYQEQQEKVFGNLRLKRILKENHGQDINQLSFFFNNKEVDLIKHRSQYDASNMLGTVGGAQVSIYDNEHMGDNLDLVSNFNLAKTSVDDQNYKENNLNTFCWLSLNDTAMIAAGGIDGHVHILSITKSKEVAVLKGHTKPIIDLQRHPRNDKYILSISKDGTIRLWDMEKQQCMIVYEYQCNVACFHPSGNTFITGTANGELREWNIPAYLADNKDTMMADIHHSRLLENRHGSSTIGK